MDSHHRSSIRMGLVLILLGIFFILVQAFPAFQSLFSAAHTPDMILFGVAVLLAFIGLATGAAGMAIPVCIVGGIGGIFYWQTVSGAGPISWSYAWALIPGFVGLGILVRDVFSGWPWRGLNEAIWLMALSVILFLVFAAAFGQWTVLGPYWPALLIVLGVLSLIRSFFRR
jgi:hypothetical protein